jgi:hypothetical protein
VSTARARLAAAACVALGGVAALAASGAGDGSSPAGAARATDSWAALAPSPLQRTEVGAARIGNRIFVVGGFSSAGGSTGEMIAYDITRDRWESRRPLPIAVNHPGVTVLRRHLFVLGGDLEGGGKSDYLYRYDPHRDRWRLLSTAPTARSALGLVGLGRELYAIGGTSAKSAILRRVEVFHLKEKRWTRGARMPTGRNHVGATQLKRNVIVTGGRPGPINGGLRTVELYNPRRDRWRSLPSLATARSGHAAVPLGGRLGGRVAVFGGEELTAGGTTIEQVEVFDSRRDRWSAAPPMVTPRHGLGGAAMGTRIYAVEGGPEPGLAYSSALEYLDVP